MVLTSTMLGTMKVPDTAAGLDARGREASVQPLGVPLQQSQVLRKNLEIAWSNRAERAAHERRELHGPSLSLEVLLDTFILQDLCCIGLGQPRALRVVPLLNVKRNR